MQQSFGIETLLSAEEVFLEEGADTEELGGDDAEGDDHQGDGEGSRGVEDEVGAVGAEELTYHRQLGQEEIVEQIDVKRATADELQASAQGGLVGEEVAVMPEEHEHHRQQQEHGQRVGQRGPFQSEEVPLDDFERGDECEKNHHGEEPARVHQSLRALPVAMYDGAVEEEWEVADHLHEAGVVHKRVRRSPVAHGPGELAWQVAGLEKTEGNDE